MSKQLRRFIFIAFVVLFFVLSALILPYAFGYNINWSGARLQKTGMFDIKTTPSGATIYLNDKSPESFFGKLRGQTSHIITPAKLSNQAPGTYEVKLELAGYWPWSKQLVIRPNETTYLEDVYFFKKKSPQLLSEQAQILTASESNDQKLVALLSQETLFVLNWDKPTDITTIPVKVGANQQLAWSPNNEKIIVGDMLVDLKTKTLVDLKSFSQGAVTKVAWIDKDVIYFLDRSGLNQLNFKNNVISSILKNEIKLNDFTVKDNYLYYTNAEPKAYLNIRKVGESENQAKIKLSDNGLYNLINTPNNELIIKNTDNNNAYLINPGMFWLKNYDTNFIGSLTAVHFVNKDHLIYANNFELYDWSKQGNNPKLLTRISYHILNIAWHKSNNYIIFATNKTINALELDDRDTHNIATLWEADEIASPLINKAGDKIIFWSTINQVSGWYLLEI